MKNLYIILFLFIFIEVSAQKDFIKLDLYSASNGVTYKKGAHFLLGNGSVPNGTFKFVSSGGWDEVLYSLREITDNNLDATAALTESKIKQIRKFKNGHESTVIFKIGVGALTNYYINIEKAIATCEVQECQSLDQRVMTAFEPAFRNADQELGPEEENATVDKKIVDPEQYQSELELEDSFDSLDDPNSLDENELGDSETSITKDEEQPKAKDDSLWPSDNEGKYVVLPIYACLLSMGVISWSFYRKYRIQDGRYKTGYRMPKLGFRVMATKAFYIIVLTIILTPIGYLLIYLGIL